MLDKFFFDEPSRLNRFNPSMDLRPSFSSLPGVLAWSVLLLDGVCDIADIAAIDGLRVKNGMPVEGVLRALSRLERDRPGLTATTAGPAAVAAVLSEDSDSVRLRSESTDDETE